MLLRGNEADAHAAVSHAPKDLPVSAQSYGGHGAEVEELERLPQHGGSHVDEKPQPERLPGHGGFGGK